MNSTGFVACGPLQEPRVTGTRHPTNREPELFQKMEYASDMSGFQLRKVGKFIVVLMTIPVLCAHAQQKHPDDGKTAAANPSATSTPSAEDRALVEEVIVIGLRPMTSIRQEIANTEDLIYETFNELNNNDAYDIICTREAPIGSQIPRRVCRSGFMVESETAAFIDFLDTGYGEVSLSRQRLVIKHQSEIMAELANKNPDFLQLLKRRWALRQVYEKRVEACGWNLKCLN
jgi:hypothetical protein